MLTAESVLLELSLEISSFLSLRFATMLAMTSKGMKRAFGSKFVFELLCKKMQQKTFLNTVTAMITTECDRALMLALETENCRAFLCSKRTHNSSVPVHAAVQRKRYLVLDRICQMMGDAVLTVRDERLNTPLHVAARTDGAVTDIVLRYLSKNISLMIKNKDGNIPLHVACIFDNVAGIRSLVKFHPECAWIYNRESIGNSANVVSWCASTPALAAITDCVGTEIMLSRCTRGCNLLQTCVERNNMEMLHFVLMQVHNLPIFDAFFCAVSPTGQTCLHTAILYCNESMVHELLKFAPDEALSVQNCFKQTCIDLAYWLRLPRVIDAIHERRLRCRS